MGEARFAGYGSDSEHREAIAAAIDAHTAASEAVSKPLSASAFAQDAQGPTSDDLVVQAAEKMSKALTAHKGDMAVNQTFGELQAMLEGSTSADAAALAVVTFASMHPDYADHAVQAMDEYWGDWGREALQETVAQLDYAEAVQQDDLQQKAYDAHVAHRADVIGDLSNQIARKDGEDVRQVTAQMASQDQTLMYGDDVEATAQLLGYRGLAKAGKVSAQKEAFLAELDDEIERNGWAGRLHTDEEKRQHQWHQAEANASMIDFDPETEFVKGQLDALNRANDAVAGLPFDEAEFDAELRKNDRPTYATTEAMNARDAREKAEHIKRFGVPPDAN